MKSSRLVLGMFVVLFLLVLAPQVFAAGPSGTGPGDPLIGVGMPQSVPANGTQWYYFDYTGDRSAVEIDVDANAVPNIQLLVFTPDQATAFVQDPTTSPVGRGTPTGASTQASTHDLVWRGAFNFPGRFFAVVTNANPFPATVSVLISGTNVTTAPTATPTPRVVIPNPYATPIASGNIQGRVVLQDASGGIIYTVNGDGSGLKRVTTGLDPSWSPDGKQIAFSRWNQPAGLYAINADGSNEQALFGSNQLLSPQWSPDGTRIAFVRQSGGSLQDTQFCFGRFCFTSPASPHWKLGVIPVGTTTLSEPPCSDHCFSPTWSSDNHTLVYADAQVGVMATDTTSSSPAYTLYNANPDVQSTSFSPDGTKIAFQVRQHDHWEINWMNADGSGVRAVTFADPLSFSVVNSVAPTWSPDGKQILFLSDRNGKWEFFVVNLDGSGLTQVLKSVTDSITVRYNFSNERVVEWIK